MPALVALLALVLTSCGNAPQVTPGQAGTVSGEPILIGVSSPLTGPNALCAQWKQGFDLARALMGRPRLICMDEPTMGLSPRYVDRALELI